MLTGTVSYADRNCFLVWSFIGILHRFGPQWPCKNASALLAVDADGNAEENYNHADYATCL